MTMKLNMGKHVNTQLFCHFFFTGKTVKVITDEQLQWDIIKSMHKVLGDTLRVYINGKPCRTEQN